MIVLMLLACAGDKTADDSASETMAVSVPFRARVAGQDFSCDATYEGLGTGANAIEPFDLRFYVHDLALLDADGGHHLVTLDEDGQWQGQGVALLDFEDDSGSCNTGSPDKNDTVTGTVEPGDYVGMFFEIGVPDGLNHIDAATAAPPLNDTGLWWSWTGGFKFMKIDARTEAGNTFVFHLGATDCAKAEDGSYGCALENAAEVTLDDFDPAQDAVALDLADLYADSDLSGVLQEGDMMPGCMSSEGDPECTALFGALGLPWGESTSPGPQTLFTVEAR